MDLRIPLIPEGVKACTVLVTHEGYICDPRFSKTCAVDERAFNEKVPVILESAKSCSLPPCMLVGTSILNPVSIRFQNIGCLSAELLSPQL